MLTTPPGEETRSLVGEAESFDHGRPSEVSSGETRRRLIVGTLLLASCACSLAILGRQNSNAEAKSAKPLRQLTLKSQGPPPPTNASEYNSLSWPPMKVSGTEEMHIFAIGDWGGLDGVITPVTQTHKMVMYQGGETPGPHVFAHRPGACTDPDMVLCFESAYRKQFPGGCKPACGFHPDIDVQPQILVAEQMKARAKTSDPKFVLNVGDNFYYGGIPLPCGSPMAKLTGMAGEMFDEIFNNIYSGPGLDGKPWLSVLGNHDYGGWLFTNAWDQQIAYTWHSDRWLMPAQYFMQHVDFPDQGISMDIFMLDSNAQDAATPDAVESKNLCSRHHNPPGASCAATGGPPSVDRCSMWFQNLWKEQQRWTERKMSASGADWQVIVTHFPCGHAASWYKMLHNELGLDLLVTGHTHIQQVFEPGGALGGLTCLITGGGGGILSDVPPHDHDTNAYGFFDITITKEVLTLESINLFGKTLGKWTIGGMTTTTTTTTSTTTTTTTTATTTTTIRPASAQNQRHGHAIAKHETHEVRDTDDADRFGDQVVPDNRVAPTIQPGGSFMSWWR
eukprot:TRINITY_DN2454_c0_g1_i1.p1 TRINITY_DN2454_c0_g1~~TRINITY_DN2454_c0_g1_i1.p1  ORF type:complete len:563 (+),score=76.40 TRINITY_DN2454_c0_g1_i1:77-1765(+)